MGSRQLIARNIRAIRLSKRISQEVLALEAEIDRSYVSGLERGLENPTVDLLDKLAEALAVKTIEFFARPPSEMELDVSPGWSLI